MFACLHVGKSSSSTTATINNHQSSSVNDCSSSSTTPSVYLSHHLPHNFHNRREGLSLGNVVLWTLSLDKNNVVTRQFRTQCSRGEIIKGFKRRWLLSMPNEASVAVSCSDGCTELTGLNPARTQTLHLQMDLTTPIISEIVLPPPPQPLPPQPPLLWWTSSLLSSSSSLISCRRSACCGGQFVGNQGIRTGSNQMR